VTKLALIKYTGSTPFIQPLRHAIPMGDALLLIAARGYVSLIRFGIASHRT
jgi:hypothetical protein